jgi:hypothetical protein
VSRPRIIILLPDVVNPTRPISDPSLAATLDPVTVASLGKSIDELLRHVPSMRASGLRAIGSLWAYLTQQRPQTPDEIDQFSQRVGNVARLTERIAKRFVEHFMRPATQRAADSSASGNAIVSVSGSGNAVHSSSSSSSSSSNASNFHDADGAADASSLLLEHGCDLLPLLLRLARLCITLKKAHGTAHELVCYACGVFV